MPSLRTLWLVPLAAWVGVTALSGGAATERVVMHVEQWRCHVSGGDPHYNQCLEPYVAVEPPRFCYQTLARVDCYAEPVRFGPDIGWQRAAPPDLVY